VGEDSWGFAKIAFGQDNSLFVLAENLSGESIRGWTTGIIWQSS
jgi:hypothetical protein